MRNSSRSLDIVMGQQFSTVKRLSVRSKLHGRSELGQRTMFNRGTIFYNHDEELSSTKNRNHRMDLEYAIQMNRWLLKPLGLWPSMLNDGVSIIVRCHRRSLIVISSFLLGFILLPGSLYTLIEVKQTDVRVKLAGALSFCIMAIIKYVSLLTGNREIGRCIAHLEQDWGRVASSGTDRDTMINHALLGRYGTILCAIFMYGGGIFYAIVMPILRGNVTIAGTNVSLRPLAYPSYYFVFDPQVRPYYEIVFAIHCCCAFVMHSIATAGCALAVVFVMHACGQFEILVNWLNLLVDADIKENDTLDRRIALVIEQHVRVLRFVDSTEKVLRSICLVEMAGCTLNLCLLGHYFLLEWEQSDSIAILTYTILLISFTFNIFLFCYIGELLTEECRKVGETTYMIDWYRLPAKKALGLILMIATANRPTTITAGSLVELSLASFCSVVRTSLTYLNLLRTVVL